MLRIIKTIEIDLSHERKRINKCFKGDKDTRKHLHELMDLIEDCKWMKAYNLLRSEWWEEYDPKEEHSRLEFIGSPTDKNNDYVGGVGYSYITLIEDMLMYPLWYKAEKVEA